MGGAEIGEDIRRIATTRQAGKWFCIPVQPRLLCIVNIRAIASYVTRHHSPRPNRCQSVFVLPCVGRWPGHCSRLSAHKPDNGVHPETMAGGHAELVWWRVLLSGNETFQSVCLCLHITITTVIESQGESQVKQRTIATNVDETISSASIHTIHQLISWDDFTGEKKILFFFSHPTSLCANEAILRQSFAYFLESRLIR